MVIWTAWVVSSDFCIRSYQCSLSNFTAIFLHMLKCSWIHYLSCLFMYYSLNSNWHVDIVCSTVSSNCVQSLHLLLLSVCDIFVAWYLVCNAWSFAATISPSVSPFRSPLDSHRNVSSSPIRYTPILLIYRLCITYLSHFFFKKSPNFALRSWIPFFFCHCSHLIGLVRLQPLMPLELLNSYLVDRFVTFNSIYKLVFYVFCVQLLLLLL